MANTELKIYTNKREELINITSLVQNFISEKGIIDGLVHIYIPHTTAAITINENADPDVVRDLLYGLEEIVPVSGYRHAEGNSTAHIKSSLLGLSLMVGVEKGRLVLGTWQAIYFCEFDGPRHRKIWLQILENNDR